MARKENKHTRRAERICAELDKRCIVVAHKIASTIRAQRPAWTTDDPYPMTDERFCADSNVSVFLPGRKQMVGGFTVECPHSQAFDGYEPGDPEAGWTAGVQFVFYGGQVGPGGMVANFTPDVWTDDEEEVYARLESVAEGAEDFAQAVIEAIESRKTVEDSDMRDDETRDREADCTHSGKAHIWTAEHYCKLCGVEQD